ncbi:MAG: PaaI family thioesterase [Gammaproteobacteria bacterium]
MNDGATAPCAIRTRALTALALNRTPGFHFIGNFLGVQFDEIAPDHATVRIDTGPWGEDANGWHDFSAVCLLADVALASVVRANLHPAQRLATVSLHLQLTGAPLTGALTGEGRFGGFLAGAHGRQGLSRATLTADARPAAFATGSFMVLDPPPGVTMHPVMNADHARITPLREAALSPEERRILARVTAAAGGEPRGFLQRLWGHAVVAGTDGATATLVNGPHVGNRVGHVQGGLQVGLAAAAARAALPGDWMLSGLAACFVRPGEGRVLRARARVTYRGRQTAVVQTTITGRDRRRLLEVQSTHARRGGLLE